MDAVYLSVYGVRTDVEVEVEERRLDMGIDRNTRWGYGKEVSHLKTGGRFVRIETMGGEEKSAGTPVEWGVM